MKDAKVTQARGKDTDTSWWDIFLQELSVFPNVSRAARKAGIVRWTAYRHREEFPSFSESWENALQTGLDRWEEEAARRAFEGVNKPVIYKGEITDTFKEYSDTLAVTMLKAHRPEKYRDRMDIHTEGELKISVEFGGEDAALD